MTSVLAMDIGTRELRIVEGDHRHLRRQAAVLLPEGALDDGVPTPLLTTAIRSAIDGGGLQGKVARVAVTDAGVATRDFRLPLLRPSELSQAVLFEGRRRVPMAASDVYFAWDARRDRQGYSVYLAAARRDMIDGIANAVAAAGLLVDRIDLKPLALARGVGAASGLLLDWQLGEAALVLVVDGRPRFFRSFLLDAAPDDIEGQLDELVLSLNALVKFMRSSDPDLSIGPATPLYLAGRFAFVPEGMERTRQRFAFPLRTPLLRMTAASSLPWQAHLTGIGLLQKGSWRSRLTPSQGGDNRVAA